MNSNEMFATGILLGVLSATAPSLPEAKHVFDNDRENFHLVLLPYFALIALTIYLIGAKKK